MATNPVVNTHSAAYLAGWTYLKCTAHLILGLLLVSPNGAHAASTNYPITGLWSSAYVLTHAIKSADWGAVADSTCLYLHPVPVQWGWFYTGYRATSPIPSIPVQGGIIQIECNVVGDGVVHIGGGWMTGSFLVYSTTQCADDGHANYSGGKCYCHTGYIVNAANNKCIPDELIISLLGATTTEPSQPLKFTATVTNRSDGLPPKEQVTVKISLSVDDTSGGHDHGDSTRPRGSLDNTPCTSDDTCLTGQTNANGVVSFDFKPRDASGKHTITASCEKCSSDGNGNTKTVEVKVDGLELIPDSTFYTFVGDTPKHTQNHYLKPEAANYLLAIAIYYQTLPQFKKLDWRTGASTTQPPKPIAVNDASLVWGGKFDISGKWKGSHKEHKRGTSVDIRANQGGWSAIPPSAFKDFNWLLDQVIPQGAADEKFILECNQTEKDADGNPVRIPENHCISTLDFSQDTNRHYHIRLLGD